MLRNGAVVPQLLEDEERRNRWEYLTEGIQRDSDDRSGAYRRKITEFMLDTMSQFLNEETTAAGLTTPTFTTFAFPLVRRVYPRLLSADLFSVQPMTQPTGKIFFLDFLRGSSPGSGTRLDSKADFNKDYATSSEGGAVKEINLDVSDTPVSAEEKKLKAKWTIELQQDLKAYHQLDAETELMTVLGDEITREIDQILIQDCLANAGAGNTNWNINGYAGADWIQKRYYNETLYESMIDASNNVLKLRYRNPNWIIAGIDECARLQKLQGFTLASVADNQWNIQHGGRHLFGTLQNRWLIYQDPWFTANKYMFGYKGDSWIDAGYVYAPYIPFYVSPMLFDPDDFKGRRGMMSRYAKKMVVSEMYSTLTLTTS